MVGLLKNFESKWQNFGEKFMMCLVGAAYLALYDHMSLIRLAVEN